MGSSGRAASVRGGSIAGSSTCYSDEEGTVIPGCVCHPSCASCGYYANPKCAVDCIECADPSDSLTVEWDDGTGYCGEPTNTTDPDCIFSSSSSSSSSTSSEDSGGDSAPPAVTEAVQRKVR